MSADKIDESGVGDINPWGGPDRPSPALAAAYERMTESLRNFQNIVSAARPTAAVADEISGILDTAAGALAEFAVDESAQIAGRQTRYPGRSQAMSPVLRYKSQSMEEVTGSVEFGRFYLGGNGAAHGGAIPLFFDEVLGRLAGGGRPRCRTAYLHVNFRKITPIERPLTFTGKVDRIEGRKLFLVGTLNEGEDLLADAQGLFVTLEPGQP
ncbi:hotdog fold domain-containing protein [Nocardia jiangxiensis]|uniref:Hotdog fold domain-containing protein n=1 Tax=Nocardia jiangxiensis TaxID=282685 RepID=A0ABW6SCB0_9NOCA